MTESMALIRGVLSDAEQKTPQSSALSQWLRQVKRVFCDAEDIVDDFECEALRKHVVKTYGSCSRKVSRFFSKSNPAVYRLRMAHHIQDINTRLTKLASQRTLFALQVIDRDTRVVHVRKMTHSHVNPSNVTGREHDRNEIIKLLVQDGDCQSLSVISIVGMGGLGKTTLAKLVFNDTNIDECFQLKMWVCVSNDFELRNVLIKILNSAPNPTRENFNDFETEQLQIRLRETLEGQKFLLVLDDVWNEDPEKWDELKEIIDLNVEGSKVLVTTRSRTVTATMRNKSSNLYLLGCLSEEDSLSLFVKYAFDDGEEKKHPQLLEIGKEIVEKCGGLPLAVKTVGSSLFSRFDKKEWESIRDNEIWNLQQNERGILPALKLSYDQLPSYLKPCFASFSLFPEDTSIHCSHISTLWEALGFLPPPKESESMMEVANHLVHELWSRSFLSDYLDYGSDSSFTLHDLVHDLATYIAKGEFERIDLRNKKNSENAQHLAFMENNLLAQAFPHKGLRSVCLPEGMNNEAFLITLVSRCKYLRVLELCSCELESLPYFIGKLKHLRYHNLQCSEKLRRLPDSVCELQNLQTLNLSGCVELQELPKGIRNLISLRNLVITTKQVDFPDKDIAVLTSLENLYICYCHNLESLFNGIQLSTLKKLSLFECESLKSVPFHAITNLKSLVICQCPKLELSMSLGSQIPDSKLKFVYLGGLPQLVTLPQWIQGSANSLQFLLIEGCINLKEFPDWLVTLVYLKLLSICSCPNLLSLPDNMHQLTNLQKIDMTGCPELWKKFKPRVGQDWYKISHIKHVLNDDSENEQELSE
ncbi:putative disease resistance protein RGA3 isoform X1 [Vigna angularis]|nr:putative disease resistance protein RGA3 isoform X1 [Vigna angularis]XP_052730127.1 putative disease resistance protein RGA3 isoform X1 [Vigna angularis]XP_052730128.1 putative disease resistance protein RGA3 isoform X1 [Vigna angularis]XP_052730129.1 putative disease resistance protein RGA3 isoform X1 [Vigna angularis]XP_052730130.1 putative disease resistance protein RGA3 isoform X1 [Vigna angularis]XP_052730131.1 putative disease resistance protein RGA3 isoform X1 [Vigna angularis]